MKIYNFSSLLVIARPDLSFFSILGCPRIQKMTRKMTSQDEQRRVMTRNCIFSYITKYFQANKKDLNQKSHQTSKNEHFLEFFGKNGENRGLRAWS